MLETPFPIHYSCVMSTVALSYPDHALPEEFVELGSFNHSYLQVRLVVLFARFAEYTSFTNLTLDTGQLQDPTLQAQFNDSIEPDVCLYSQRSFLAPDDILKMEEMPLLAVEILSPMQGVQKLVSKMYVYFDLGVRSVWIVYPTSRTVTVYTTPDQSQSYSSGEIVDDTLGISLSLAELFR